MGVTKIGSFGFEKKIKAIKKAKINLPKLLAVEATNHFKKGFRTGGGKTNASIAGWKARKFDRVTPSGKISGSTTSGVLVLKGRLMRSVRAYRVTWQSIIIASKLPYSEIQNEGGHITQQVTAKQAAYLGHMGANLKKSGNTAMGNAYLRMANANVLNIDIPKREFIGRSRTLERRMEQTINRTFLRTIK